MKNSISKILLLLSLFTPFFVAEAQEEENHDELIEEVVALARSYLGDADDLAAIKTIQYRGVLIYGNGDSGTFSSIYKKPNFQQFTSIMKGYKEVSTLNRTEAWRKAEDVSQPGSWDLDFYEVDDIHHMQATVNEAFSFMATPVARKGRIQYIGKEDVNGRDSHILVYFHADHIWFRRNIDAETGKLLSTMNDRGIRFEEHGENVINGVRFPETLITRFMSAQGEQTMELKYTSVIVNEEVNDDLFNVPVMAR